MSWAFSGGLTARELARVTDMCVFSGFQIFSVAHLATEEGLRAKDITGGDGGAAVEFEFKLRTRVSIVAEDEAELSIAARLGAEEGELSAGMEIDCEL
jgi:hypothetical protein